MNLYDENLAEIRAMSMLVSRSLGECRCYGTGSCGMHRITPHVTTAQGQETWSIEICAAALREAGTRRSDSEVIAWAEEITRRNRPAEEPVVRVGT